MRLMCAWWYNLGSLVNTPGIAPKSALYDLCKGAQKDAPEIALKVALQVALVHAIVNA